MELPQIWRNLFENWPAKLPHAGVVVTNFGEQVSFVGFLLSEDALLIERLAPDSLGGRKLIIPYLNIQAVKITEPIDSEIFLPCGFRKAGGEKRGQDPTLQAKRLPPRPAQPQQRRPAPASSQPPRTVPATTAKVADPSGT